MKTAGKNLFSELRPSKTILIAVLAVSLCSIPAYAQKGMGDYTGGALALVHDHAQLCLTYARASLGC